MLVTVASPLLALNSPRILYRSPASCAAFALFGIENFDAALHLAIEHLGFAAQLEQLPLQVVDLPLEILFAALDDDGLTDVGEHQQQDDGAEAAADAVEERQREDFEFATFAERHASVSLMASRAKE